MSRGPVGFARRGRRRFRLTGPGAGSDASARAGNRRGLARALFFVDDFPIVSAPGAIPREFTARTSGKGEHDKSSADDLSHGRKCFPDLSQVLIQPDILVECLTRTNTPQTQNRRIPVSPALTHCASQALAPHGGQSEQKEIESVRRATWRLCPLLLDEPRPGRCDGRRR